MSKRSLILKQKGLKLYPHKKFLEFGVEGERHTIAYRHLEALYLATSIEVSLSNLLKIAKRIPLYLIDRHGYIKGEIVLEKKR